MKVLVTGGAGFIGSHTVDLLLEKGYDVRILDALKPPVHADGRVPDYVPLNHVEFIHGDVRDRTAWERALEGVDAVFHLAAYQDYLPDFSHFIHTNAESTALLFELIVSDPSTGPLRRAQDGASTSPSMDSGGTSGRRSGHRRKHYPVQKIVFASSQAVCCGEGRYLCGGARERGSKGAGEHHLCISAPQHLCTEWWSRHCDPWSQVAGTVTAGVLGNPLSHL